MISVVIPTLNEEHNIGGCLERVLKEKCVGEVLVCDGGSEDRTPEIAGEYRDGRLMLLKSRRGRGIQMNDGGFAAKGDILLFLHADTKLEKGWCDAIAEVMADQEVAAGAFTLRIDSAGRHYRLIEAWVDLRCRLFMLPYGDQAIFLRKGTFVGIGGYEEIPLMEDVDLVRRLKKAGRIVILDRKAFTAARRWETEGWIITSARNQLIMLLYRLGVGPDKLARMYHR